MINPRNIIGNKDYQHIWNFSRVGGVNRVNLETGMDLISLETLDQKLWTALSYPVHGLEIDYRTLEFIGSATDWSGKATLPENAKLNLVDPFTKKRSPVVPVLILILALFGVIAYLLWKTGLLIKWDIM